MKSSTVVPSFKYHVHAKDGIQLVVDLNVKLSDWLKSMEKEVCACQNNLKPGYESFRKEVECLGSRNNLKFSSPGKTTTLDTSVYVENKFSLNLTSIETEKSPTLAAEKEVTTVSGSKGCLSKVDQRSELVSENLKVQEIGSPPEAECPENVVFTSEQVQFSDFSNHHKGTGKICSEGLLTTTAEANQVAGDNHRHSKESTNSAEGMQVSGRDERVFVTSASNDGPKRKKCDYESNNIHDQSHPRRLRSTKLYGGQIIESGGRLIRRSSRLLS